jgi:hypothetical protein
MKTVVCALRVYEPLQEISKDTIKLLPAQPQEGGFVDLPVRARDAPELGNKLLESSLLQFVAY